MANVSVMSALINAVQRNVDLSTNTLVVDILKVGGSSGTDLTKTLLDNFIVLQAGNDIGATYHNHDSIYFSQSALASTASGSAGSTVIGDDDNYANFSNPDQTVKGALQAIDSALVSVSSLDSTFRIKNSVDQTKQISFNASAISTSTTRSITMPDADVDLTQVNSAVLIDGSRAFTADQSLGGFKLTNLADPANPQEAATKNYVDSALSSISLDPINLGDLQLSSTNPDGNWGSAGPAIMRKISSPGTNTYGVLSLLTEDTSSDTDDTPDLRLETGDVTSGSSTRYSGGLWFKTGDNAGAVASGPVDISSGQNTGSGESGYAKLYSGNSLTVSGIVSLISGSAVTSGNVNLTTGNGSTTSGDINLTTGTAGTTRGAVVVDAKTLTLNSTPIKLASYNLSTRNALTATLSGADYGLVIWYTLSQTAQVWDGSTWQDMVAITSFSANNVTYDNTTSGLTATDVQAAIDEVVADSSAPVTTQVSVNWRKSNAPASVWRVEPIIFTKAGTVVTMKVKGFSGGNFATNYITTYNDGDPSNYPVPSDCRPTNKISGRWLGLLDSASNEYFIRINANGSIDFAKTIDFDAQTMNDIDMTTYDFVLTWDTTAFV